MGTSEQDPVVAVADAISGQRSALREAIAARAAAEARLTGSRAAIAAAEARLAEVTAERDEYRAAAESWATDHDRLAAEARVAAESLAADCDILIAEVARLREALSLATAPSRPGAEVAREAGIPDAGPLFPAERSEPQP